MPVQPSTPRSAPPPLRGTSNHERASRNRPLGGFLRGHRAADGDQGHGGRLGVLVGFAGVEHGIGGLLQGPGKPGSVVIQSWPDTRAFAPLSGEPAMTMVPDLVVAGV